VDRGTVRLRLTVLYTALFVTAGAAMLGVTYVLVAQSLPSPSKLDARTTPQVDPSQWCARPANRATPRS
jgi:hypothetical protein